MEVNVVHHGRLICLLTVLCTLGGLVLAWAEPSSACRALAKQFAETPEKLREEQLFRLQACIHRELGHRGVDASSALPPPLPKAPQVPGLTSPPGSR